MNLTKVVFKTHKWLAVGAGLLTFIWFVSGCVMLLPPYVFGTVPRLQSKAPEPAPAYKEIAVTVPQAIAAVEAAVGQPVEATGVGFRRVTGKLCFEISTAKNGTHLVDALNGKRFEVTEDVARQLVMGLDVPRNDLPWSVSTVREYDADYGYGPLPVYRIAILDPAGTVYYVDATTGEMNATNRAGRLRGFLAGTHTLGFLQPAMGGRALRVTLILFSILGTVMSVFGFWILWIQFRNWRAGRKAA